MWSQESILSGELICAVFFWLKIICFGGIRGKYKYNISCLFCIYINFLMGKYISRNSKKKRHENTPICTNYLWKEVCWDICGLISCMYNNAYHNTNLISNFIYWLGHPEPSRRPHRPRTFGVHRCVAVSSWKSLFFFFSGNSPRTKKRKLFHFPSYNGSTFHFGFTSFFSDRSQDDRTHKQNIQFGIPPRLQQNLFSI